MSRTLLTITCVCGRTTEHWCDRILPSFGLQKGEPVQPYGKRFKQIQGFMNVVRYEALERAIQTLIDLRADVRAEHAESQESDPYVFYAPGGVRELTHHEVWCKAVDDCMAVLEEHMNLLAED